MKEIKIIHEKENPLLERKELKLVMHSEITPSREEVRKIISEKFSVSPDTFKIKNILGKFGSKNFEINVNIYTSKENRDETEIFSKKELEAEKKLQEKAVESAPSN